MAQIVSKHTLIVLQRLEHGAKQFIHNAIVINGQCVGKQPFICSMQAITMPLKSIYPIWHALFIVALQPGI